MPDPDRDTLLRLAAFEHVRRLNDVHGHLTANELKPGFVFAGERIPLYNPQRGIFKPQQMRFLLSIQTVFPRPGHKIWYDDQRDVHRHLFAGDETIDYAFMGEDPNAADNRWLREAFEHRVPVIYFLGVDPDYRVHVSARLLSLNDGPMLDALKRLNGGALHLPHRPRDNPDRDRLALRFERFKGAV